jgi:hypothetical protein
MLKNDIKILRKGEVGYGYLIENDAGFINPLDERNKLFVEEVNKIERGKIEIVEPLVVYAILQKYDVLNRNGRIYPENILKRQVEVYQKQIKERNAIGELEHPESSQISTDRVSHNIVETWWEGKTLMGKIEILMTPGFIKHGIVSTKGDDVANLLRHNIKIGVSSRGVGSLENDGNGNHLVQEDFEIICWDIVTAPSTPNAWLFNDRKDAIPYMESNNIKKPNINETLITNLNNFLKNY